MARLDALVERVRSRTARPGGSIPYNVMVAKESAVAVNALGNEALAAIVAEDPAIMSEAVKTVCISPDHVTLREVAVVAVHNRVCAALTGA